MERGYEDGRGRWRARRLDTDTPSVLRMLSAIEAQVEEGRRHPPHETVLTKMIDAARRDDGMASDAQLKRLQTLASKCGLSRQDRLDIADVLLKRAEPVTTWKGLTLREAEILSAALEGFALIAWQQAEQGRRWRYGRCPASPCPMRGDPDPEASAQALLHPPSG